MQLRPSRHVLLAAGVALTALAAPALADDPFVPVLSTQQVFFVCGADKVDNVRRAQGGPAPTWGTAKPAASVSTGAGCGTVDSPFTQTAVDNMYDSTWSGKVTGNLDAVTVELHSIDVARSRAAGTGQLQVRLLVDGEELTPGAQGLGAAVTVTPVPSSTRASDAYVFTVTGLGFTGEGDQGVHEVTLQVNGGAVIQRGPSVMDAVHGFVWGASVVPSGLVFNPAKPAAATLAASRPAPAPEGE